MSIASEITRIQNAKTDLKSSIEAKGVSVPAEAKIDAYSTLVDSISSGGGQEISGQVEVTLPFGEALNKGDAVVIKDVYSHDTSIKLGNPNALPPGTGTCIAASRDGLYIAHGSTVSPYVSLFKRVEDTIIKLSTPLITPASQPLGMAFSPDSTYLAVNALTTSPRLHIYKREGDVFTKLPDPAILPQGYGNDVIFTPDGNYLIVAHGSSPYMSIYRCEGDVFTKISNPALLPPTSCSYVRISHDGRYVVLGHTFSPYVTLYERNGEVFTRLGGISPLLPTGAETKGLGYSPDGNYLAIAHSYAPYLSVFKRDGNIFNQIPFPDVGNSSVGFSSAFSSDGNYLFYGCNASPYLRAFKRNGDEFTLINNFDAAVTTPVKGLSISSNDKYLFSSSSSSPYIFIHKANTYVATKAFKSNNALVEVNNSDGAGYAAQDGLEGEEKKVIKIWG